MISGLAFGMAEKDKEVRAEAIARLKLKYAMVRVSKARYMVAVLLPVGSCDDGTWIQFIFEPLPGLESAPYNIAKAELKRLTLGGDV